MKLAARLEHGYVNMLGIENNYCYRYETGDKYSLEVILQNKIIDVSLSLSV